MYGYHQSSYEARERLSRRYREAALQRLVCQSRSRRQRVRRVQLLRGARRQAAARLGA
jgi:hypothetical protein